MGPIGLGPVDPGSRGCSMDVLYLSREEIISLATLDDVLACVEVAYREKAVGRGVYPLVYEELGAAGLDGFRSNMDIRSGVSPCRGLFGVKLITEFPRIHRTGAACLSFAACYRFSMPRRGVSVRSWTVWA